MPGNRPPSQSPFLRSRPRLQGLWDRASVTHAGPTDGDCVDGVDWSPVLATPLRLEPLSPGSPPTRSGCRAGRPHLQGPARQSGDCSACPLTAAASQLPSGPSHLSPPSSACASTPGTCVGRGIGHCPLPHGSTCWATEQGAWPSCPAADQGGLPAAPGGQDGCAGPVWGPLALFWVGVPLPASPRWHPCWGLLSGNQLRGSIAGWGLSSALPVTAFPTSPLVLATRAIVLPVPGMGGWAPSARPPESWSSPSYLGWGTTLELPRKVCLQVWGPQARALTPACAPRTGLLGGSCPPGGWRNGAQWVPGLGPSS